MHSYSQMMQCLVLGTAALSIGSDGTGARSEPQRDRYAALAEPVAPNVVVPRGIFVCRGPAPTPEREVNFPFIDGWLVRPGWDRVEPEEGKYEWAYIDAEIALAKRLQKKITLMVLGGPQTPPWVYKAGARDFRYTWGGRFRESEEARIPLIWDDVYLRKWTALVSALGKRYGSEKTIVLVHISGATENGLEMQLPASPRDRPEWMKAGFTPDKVIAAWKRIIDTFAQAFPQTPLDIDIHPVVGTDKVAEDVAAYGYSKLGKRFGVFAGWLSGKGADKDRHHAGMHGLAQKYGKLSFAGFQMIGNETNQSERFQGGLKGAVDQGMGWGARYFEVWKADAVNAQLHPTLKELATSVKK
ncbi:MAG: beta-galactosidase [Gemmataceae bacterium]|nr:beta-galactosidase [Gemmataceae bacterium]